MYVSLVDCTAFSVFILPQGNFHFIKENDENRHLDKTTYGL